MSVCVLSFSPVHRDARVLRQIEFLSRVTDVVVVGLGPPHPELGARDNVRWVRLDGDASSGEPSSVVRAWRAALPQVVRDAIGRVRHLVREGAAFFVLAIAGRLMQAVYDRVFWRPEVRRRALDAVIAAGCDTIHANDWDGLPVGVAAAEATGARVVYDAHEYAPLEWANRARWRWTQAPMRRRLLSVYAPRVHGSVTVSPPIAVRLAREYGLDPLVVLNAPEPGEPVAGPPADGALRLVHHGGASPERELDRMIHAVGRCGDRVTLDFFLVGTDDPALRRYVDGLRTLADTVAPGRISFRDPVGALEITRALARYHAGIYLLPQTNYNHRAALPNKLFDFIAAGLAVVVGPTEAMAALVREHGCGLVAPSNEPDDVATVLGALDAVTIDRLQAASRRAAVLLGAARQHAPLVELHERLAASRTTA